MSGWNATKTATANFMTYEDILETIKEIVGANKQLNMDSPATQEHFAKMLHQRLVERQNIALRYMAEKYGG